MGLLLSNLSPRRGGLEIKSLGVSPALTTPCVFLPRLRSQVYLHFALLLFSLLQ